MLGTAAAAAAELQLFWVVATLLPRQRQQGTLVVPAEVCVFCCAFG
jgi:hypothetical protein